ncbi:hypothetical protein [Hymenobacter negativus]|uniref:DUF4198 domain-containing protein n=1 Tax=Hymenobacter negativus TaxID=2795026 RepID=A0ABS3QI18_9BACT|nr:hypothetical protein [Hymenobacter negativus]MBO2010886.1 hypothetical protein [Hymenobacter negativus]
MKKLFWLGACLLALSVHPVKAQATNPEIAVVRVYEYETWVELVIVRGPDQSEILKFDSGTTEKSLTKSGKGYYNALFKLYQEGYSLQSTFTATPTAAGSFTTLLFVKAPKP